jgi:hypothetical protein
LYDLEESLIASYYNAYNAEGKVVGYIITSKDKGLPPVLQFGENEISDEFLNLVKEGNKVYYFGGFNYLFGKNAKEVINA